MSKPDSPGVYLMPPIIFFACLIGGIAGTVVYGGTVPYVPWLVRLISGVVIAVAGFVFMMWGHGRFRRLGVNVKTILPASQLVTEGAHGVSRNPMYVGFVALLAGTGWAAGSLPMLAGALVMFLYLDWYVIRREEAYLTRTFGEDYKAYRRRVRRWL